MRPAFLLAALITLTLLGCGNKNIDASCQGNLEILVSRNSDQSKQSYSKIYSYRYDDATKQVTFNDVTFPPDRTLNKDGIITASKVPVNKIGKDDSTDKETEWVEYNVKTNVLKYDHLYTSMSKDKSVFVVLGKQFESICTPSK